MRYAAELIATAPRGPSAIYRLADGDFVRALASRRRYASEHGAPLASEEEIRSAIAVDGKCWLEAPLTGEQLADWRKEERER